MKLSEHFDSEEFQDPDAGIVPAVAPEFVAALEKFRAGPIVKGRAVRISHRGGYRTAKTNALADGADQSQHMILPLRCADLVVEGLTGLDLFEAALQIPEFAAGGIGCYPRDGHVHVDMRRSGRARWIG